jgi:hypothetical protein
MDPLHPRLLVISFLVAILAVGEYCSVVPTITNLATAPVVIYLFRRRSQSRANSVVFVGTPDAGKTSILSTVRGLATYHGS